MAPRPTRTSGNTPFSITSALEQTVADFEVLVVDDGSTDGTAQVAERLVHRDARVRLWVHEENARAEAFYRGLGFSATGRTMADPKDSAASEREMALRRG